MADARRRWFCVISSGRTVEILDGPFDSETQADHAAGLHAKDGELGVYARLRFPPRRPNWVPIHGPCYDRA